jgi:hypothetical protein
VSPRHPSSWVRPVIAGLCAAAALVAALLLAGVPWWVARWLLYAIFAGLVVAGPLYLLQDRGRAPDLVDCGPRWRTRKRWAARSLLLVGPAVLSWGGWLAAQGHLAWGVVFIVEGPLAFLYGAGALARLNQLERAPASGGDAGSPPSELT